MAFGWGYGPLMCARKSLIAEFHEIKALRAAVTGRGLPRELVVSYSPLKPRRLYRSPVEGLWLVIDKGYGPAMRARKSIFTHLHDIEALCAACDGARTRARAGSELLP